MNYSNGIFRLFSLTVILVLVAFSFSCKKDNDDPKPSGNPGSNGGGTETQPLVASADFKFTNDSEEMHFECYKKEYYGEISVQNNETMYLRFRNVDQEGNIEDAPTLMITLKNNNGFNTAETYSLGDNPNTKEISVQLVRSMSSSEQYMANNDELDYGTGELKVNSYNENYIEGVFNFEIEGLLEEEKVLISNGQFQGEVVE